MRAQGATGQGWPGLLFYNNFPSREQVGSPEDRTTSIPSQGSAGAADHLTPAPL